MLGNKTGGGVKRKENYTGNKEKRRGKRKRKKERQVGKCGKILKCRNIEREEEVKIRIGVQCVLLGIELRAFCMLEKMGERKEGRRREGGWEEREEKRKETSQQERERKEEKKE